MASKTYKVIGRLKCASCGEEIPARQSENGTLNLSCWLCGVTAHAKPGTEAHRRAMDRVTLKPGPTPAPAPADDPAPAPAPADDPAPAPAPAPAKRTAFGIFNV